MPKLLETTEEIKILAAAQTDWDDMDELSSVVPLIASAVRRAMQTGAAWEVRGFGMHPTRTYCRKTRSSRADPIFVSIWAIALIAYVLLMDQNVLSAITFQPPK